MGRDFRKIKAWQMADDLAVKIYELSKSFPKEEVYGLTSQLRRAMSSVPANIAEGSSRNYRKEYLQSLNIAKGSLAEADYFLHLANRLRYVADNDYQKLLEEIRRLGATLHGLIQAVKKDE